MRPTRWAVAVVVLAGIAIVSLALGAVPLEPGAIFSALRGVGEPSTVAIIRDIRLPRVLLGAMVGAGLGMSGAALQGTLRNALAEPYLLGVSGGAAVGAVLAVTTGWAGRIGVPLAACAGAIAAAGLVLAVARASTRRSDPRVLLMAGVVVGAFANAAIMVALSGAAANTVRGALWWMMGSLADAGWSEARWLAGAIVLAGGALLWWARDIDLLALGEEPAAALGVDIDRAGRRVFLAASVLAAATVAAAGLIGFVGLIVPHLARAAGARGHRALLAGSALGGAALLLAADLAARTVRAPAELPLGAVTALMGVPFFLARLRRVA
jgi:iron complex transport system permease protein